MLIDAEFLSEITTQPTPCLIETDAIILVKPLDETACLLQMRYSPPVRVVGNFDTWRTVLMSYQVEP